MTISDDEYIIGSKLVYGSSKVYTLPNPIDFSYKYIYIKIGGSQRTELHISKFHTKDILENSSFMITNCNDWVSMLFTATTLKLIFTVASVNQTVIHDIWQSNR